MPGRARAGAAHDARRLGRHGRAPLPDDRRRRRLVLISDHDPTRRLRADALAAWHAGLEAVEPARAVRRALESRGDLHADDPRLLVIAVGKAAAGMLRGMAVEPARAFVLLPDGAPAGDLPPNAVVLRGGHPEPTREGLAATQRILREAGALRAGERLLLLLSGGASALLEAPADGLDFDDLAAMHRILVASGLAIADINLVRGCLSSVKAGGLALRAHPAHVTTLAISDVERDDPAVIGSAPTFLPTQPPRARARSALAILDAVNVTVPPSVRRFLAERIAANDSWHAPPVASDYTVVASIHDAARAATAELERRGYRCDAPSELRGSTAQAAELIVDVASRLQAEGAARAAVFGGETTVAIAGRAAGRGGRNLEVAARVAVAIDGRRHLAVVCAGTDGVDGSSRAAGAIVDGGTAARANRAGRPLEDAIARLDTEAALDACEDLVVTGPTGTNVGDLSVVVCDG